MIRITKITKRILIGCLLLGLVTSLNMFVKGAETIPVASWSENFDSYSTMTTEGWIMSNQSNPLGTTNWFQGDVSVIQAYSGASDSYIGANFNNTSSTGTIDNWLFTPVITFNNGGTISFYTRRPDSVYPDRLEVLLSTSEDSTDISDFSVKLVEVNPNLDNTSYPTQWTKYTATITGLDQPTNGRIAFRYYVTDAGATGTNSDYIGIDDVEYSWRPEVALSANSVEMGGVTGGGVYDYGTPVTVIATPQDSYSFAGWKNEAGIIESTSLEYSFNAIENKTLVAEFVRNTGTLNVQITPDDSALSDAKWSIDGGVTWNKEGILTLPTGTYSLVYSDINGYITPNSVENISIITNETTTLDAHYVQLLEVNLPPITGCTILPETGFQSPVQYGGSYSFHINLENGYNKSIFTVKANGITLTPAEGVYTISNITESQNITVEGVQINTYPINISVGTGFTILPESGYLSPVNYCNNYSFHIDLDPKYSSSVLTVKTNSKILTPVDGVYTISNITEAQSITVEGVQINTYPINTSTGTGFTILPENGYLDLVNYGNNYSFHINLDSNYSNSVLTVKANGKTLTPVNGVYTISNITEAQSITVEGVQINTYPINASTGTGFTILPENGYLNSVNYGNSYSFHVNLEIGYSNSAITVKANDKTLTPVNGIYTISNITEAQRITVEGVQINTYKFTVIGGSGSGVYTAGTDIVISATAVSGKIFDKWTISAGGSLNSATSATTTFVMPSADVTIIAEFKSNATTVIKPAKPSITLKAGKKYFKVSWKKITGASGYEVSYSKSKTASFSKKTVKTTTYKKSGLKKNKRYYIKVRAYKVVNGKKIYGSYSKLKSIKIK